MTPAAYLDLASAVLRLLVLFWTIVGFAVAAGAMFGAHREVLAAQRDRRDARLAAARRTSEAWSLVAQFTFMMIGFLFVASPPALPLVLGQIGPYVDGLLRIGGFAVGAMALTIKSVITLTEIRRLQTEEQTQSHRTRARLAAIVESSVDAVIGSKPDGTISEWNPGAERLFGYTEAEIIGKPWSVLVPEDRGHELQDNRRRLLAGEAVATIDTVRIRKDGKLIDVSSSEAVIRDGHGAVVGFAAIVRDETERIEAARRREDLESKLRQTERLESLGRLAGGVAHDLNNILSVVTNYAEFVADRLPPGDEGRSDLERIRHAAERGTAFTRQLLTFARRGPAQRTELRLDELLTELRSLLGRALPENITFELRVPAEIWSVVADRGQIEQVMLNLVVNARDAMPDGGRLLVEASNVEYDEVSASQHADLHPGRYVLVTVSDTGHGMTKEVMDRVFEPFFTTKPTGQGTGLGLATVYGVVQQTGGRISIYSEVGRGTTMRVLLPAVRTSAPAVVESPQAAASVRPGTVILLVEDEDAVREAARRILTAAGYDVVAAPSAAVGLEKSAGRQKIDLLLTDMVMPGMSGRELAHRMRAARPNIRVVFMSGYAEEISTREDQLEGPLLMKPFTRRPLLDLVAATVQGMAA